MDKAAAEIARELGLPDGFLGNLMNEDDWSAIVKMHALIESAATHLLVHYFGHNELEGVFANLELSNSRTGKLAFLRDLNCIEPAQRRFIRRLSELRNMLVHDITNVQFSLSKYVHGLDRQQYDSLLDDLGFVKEKLSNRELVAKHAKVFFMASQWPASPSCTWRRQ